MIQPTLTGRYLPVRVVTEHEEEGAGAAPGTTIAAVQVRDDSNAPKQEERANIIYPPIPIYVSCCGRKATFI